MEANPKKQSSMLFLHPYSLYTSTRAQSLVGLAHPADRRGRGLVRFMECCLAIANLRLSLTDWRGSRNMALGKEKRGDGCNVKFPPKGNILRGVVPGWKHDQVLSGLRCQTCQTISTGREMVEVLCQCAILTIYLVEGRQDLSTI